MEAGGWWKGQLPTGEFGWVPGTLFMCFFTFFSRFSTIFTRFPGEFLDILPKKPEDWANRQPANKNRLTVKVNLFFCSFERNKSLFF